MPSRPAVPTRRPMGSSWVEAKQALERAVQRHGREGRAAALQELAAAATRCCAFVERVRWTQLCEQPMRYVERRYAELWAEIARTSQQTRGARRMTTDREPPPDPHANAAAAQPRGREVRARRGAARRAPPALRWSADEQLRPEHFYREQYGHVFAAMLELHDVLAPDRPSDRRRGAARAAVSSTQIGGPGAIDELAGWVPAAGHAREYGRIVRDNALSCARCCAPPTRSRRRSAERRRGGEEMIEEAERLIFALRGDERARQAAAARAGRRRGARPPRTGAERPTARSPGSPTGIPDLDRLLGGLQDGRLYVVAARPAMGKSLLSLQFARHVRAARAPARAVRLA